MILKFEQVIDSRRAQNIIPFIVFERNMVIESNTAQDDNADQSKSSNEDYSQFSI